MVAMATDGQRVARLRRAIGPTQETTPRAAHLAAEPLGLAPAQTVEDDIGIDVDQG